MPAYQRHKSERDFSQLVVSRLKRKGYQIIGSEPMPDAVAQFGHKPKRGYRLVEVSTGETGVLSYDAVIAYANS